MKSLDSVDWKDGALNTINHSFKLDDQPACLFLRHSAREFSKNFSDDAKCPLTEIGCETAIDFGNRLNPNKFYRVYYSPIPRCQNTARYIIEGLTKNRLNPQLMGEEYSLIEFQGVKTEFPKYLTRDLTQVINYWVSNFYPPWEMEPPQYFAQRCIKNCLNHLKNNCPHTINLYIGHDLTILVLLFYLGGILATENWISFLEGFSLQILGQENKLRLLFKDKEKIVPYPYWWPSNHTII